MVFVLDIIDEILVQQASVHPNVHVVSNYMDFDENVLLNPDQLFISHDS
jgi:hypothetical protein